jgi:restriction endonuclease EcoRV
VHDLDLIVQQPWKIASRQRSSTTREYIGAVQNIEALRQGKGEFETPDEFYNYWRKYKFKIGDVVQKHLDKLLAAEVTAWSIPLTNANGTPTRRAACLPGRPMAGQDAPHDR